MKFVNLTPHAIVILRGEEKITIPPSGQVARVREDRKSAGEILGIPVFVVEYGEIEGLPAPAEDTIYLVSSLVLAALKAKGVARPDVLAPDTGAGAVRNEQGQIVGVKALLTATFDVELQVTEQARAAGFAPLRVPAHYDYSTSDSAGSGIYAFRNVSEVEETADERRYERHWYEFKELSNIVVRTSVYYSYSFRDWWDNLTAEQRRWIAYQYPCPYRERQGQCRYCDRGEVWDSMAEEHYSFVPRPGPVFEFDHKVYTLGKLSPQELVERAKRGGWRVFSPRCPSCGEDILPILPRRPEEVEGDFPVEETAIKCKKCGHTLFLVSPWGGLHLPGEVDEEEKEQWKRYRKEEKFRRAFNL